MAMLSEDMYYTYILRSSKSHIFYYGSTKDLRKRFFEHNNGISKSTKPHIPWKLVFYAAFETEKQAKGFELYLKSGSGKAFAYKRLVNEALNKDVLNLKVLRSLSEGYPLGAQRGFEHCLIW